MTWEWVALILGLVGLGVLLIGTMTWLGTQRTIAELDAQTADMSTRTFRGPDS